MIHAISGEIDFINVLKTGEFKGWVHSTFNKTINIKSGINGELYTIACSLMDNGPNTLVININSFQDTDIELNDSVFVENNILYIGNKLSISFEPTGIWECVLPAYPLDVKIIEKNVMKMKDYIKIHGTDGGIKKALTFRNSFEEKMSELLEERTRMLYSDLLNNRMADAKEHAVSLIGLGPGLTPSGDDFLVGLFTICNMQNNPFYVHKSFCVEVAERAKSLTNDISYITLKKASIGKVRESISCLIHSLLEEDDENFTLSLKKVINIGSSSGTDIALGIVCGVEANLKIGGKLCP